MYRHLSTVGPFIDFHAFYLAAEAAHRGDNPYRAGQEMYIYPPMLAALMGPLTLTTEVRAAWIWYGLTLSIVLLLFLLIWRVLRKRLRLPNEPGMLVLTLGLTLFFWITELRGEFEEGQTDWLVLAGICIALASINRSSVILGFALGFSINIKYLPVVLVAYLAARQRWRDVTWTAVGTIFWALLPACVYGWQENLLYLRQGLAGLASLIGIHIEGQAGNVFLLTYDRSVTLPSGFARWAEEQGLGFSFVFGMTFLCAAIGLFGIWLTYRKYGLSLVRPHFATITAKLGQRGLVVLEYTTALMFMMVFSPQAMVRHFLLVLPLGMVAVMLAIGSSVPHTRILASIALCFALLGSAGADVVTPLGWRAAWKASSSMSICMVIFGFLTLAVGLSHLKQLTNAVEFRR